MKIRCKNCDYIAYAADGMSDRALRNHDCAVCGCIGFHSADDLADEFDDEPVTREIPRETMAALVFGVESLAVAS